MPVSLKIRILLLVYSIVKPAALFSQSHEYLEELYFPETSVSENISEELTENATDLPEYLWQFSEKPLDINSATANDFEMLGFITRFKAEMIVEYRLKNGSFASVYELNGVDGLSVSDLKLLLPFVCVTNTESYNEGIKTGNKHKIISSARRNFPLANGFIAADSLNAPVYKGTPWHSTLRYRASLGKNTVVGATFDNDAGETWFTEQKPLFDFNSGFVRFKNKGKFKNIIIGDYYACFGQGLLLYNGFAAGKNAMAVTVKKNNFGFREFTSTNENNYFRGIASTYKIGIVNISVLASAKKIDATQAQTDSLGNTIAVSSFKTTGFHALPADIRDRKNLGETTFGANITIAKNAWHAGLSYCAGHYSIPVIPTATLWKANSFAGTTWQGLSGNYAYKTRRFEVFGELAMMANGSLASVNGFEWQLISDLSLALFYRYLPPNYCAPYSNVFATGQNAANEKGLYAAIAFSPLANLKITAYADFYKNIAPKFNLSTTGHHEHYFVEKTWFASNNFEISARYSYLEQMLNNVTRAPNPKIYISTYSQKFRLNIKYKISEQLSFQNRAEISSFATSENANQYGNLIFQDVVLTWPNANNSLVLRYALFNVENWNCRIYAYENDLQYSFSFPAYYGKGTKINILSRISISRNIKLTGRFSITNYTDRNSIGSGPNRINNNYKIDVGLQSIWVF